MIALKSTQLLQNKFNNNLLNHFVLRHLILNSGVLSKVALFQLSSAQSRLCVPNFMGCSIHHFFISQADQIVSTAHARCKKNIPQHQCKISSVYQRRIINLTSHLQPPFICPQRFGGTVRNLSHVWLSPLHSIIKGQLVLSVPIPTWYLHVQKGWVLLHSIISSPYTHRSSEQLPWKHCCTTSDRLTSILIVNRVRRRTSKLNLTTFFFPART